MLIKINFRLATSLVEVEEEEEEKRERGGGAKYLSIENADTES